MSVQNSITTFKTSMSSPHLWNTILNASSLLAENTAFSFEEDGVKMRCMDPGHVALVDLILPKEEFASYHVEGKSLIVPDLDELRSIVKKAGPKESIEINKNQDDFIEAIIHSKLDHKFILKLQTNDIAPTPLPKLSFDTKLAISQKWIKQIVDNAQLVAKAITVTSNENGIDFAGSFDQQTYAVTFSRTSAGIAGFENNGISTATYSLEYLTKLMRHVQSDSDIVKAEYSSKMPIKLTFALGLKGTITFFLAPRVAD